MTEAPLDLADDLVLLLQACSAAVGDIVLHRVRAAVGDTVRFGDGYVFQHLVDGPRSISQLAADLGVTQQAASKQVADLRRRGLVVTRADPADGRSKLVALSRRGAGAVDAARAARRAVRDEVTALLGPRRAASLLVALRQVGEHTRADEQLRARRLRPESDR